MTLPAKRDRVIVRALDARPMLGPVVGLNWRRYLADQAVLSPDVCQIGRVSFGPFFHFAFLNLIERKEERGVSCPQFLQVDGLGLVFR